MLKWSITFLVIAIIAGVLGFTTIAGGAAVFAKILFVIAVIILVATLMAGRGRARL